MRGIKQFWNWGWSIYHKNEEVWNYLIFGAFATVVYFGTYIIATRIFAVEVLTSTAIAWVVAVIFAYTTNKTIVFKSKRRSKREVTVEFISFIICRLITLGMELAITYIMVKLMRIDDIVTKIVENIIVIITNYFLSKLIIFKKEINVEGINVEMVDCDK